MNEHRAHSEGNETLWNVDEVHTLYISYPICGTWNQYGSSILKLLLQREHESTQWKMKQIGY